MSDIKERKRDVQGKLKSASKELATLETRQREIDTSLIKLLKDKARYDALNETVANLDRLNALGGSKLFWGETSDEEESSERVRRLYQLVANFEGQLERFKHDRITNWDKIQTVKDDIHGFENLTQILLEVEEQARDEFIVERESEEPAYRSPVMPWADHPDDQRRYRRILLVLLLLALLLGYLVPVWQFPEIDEEVTIEVPERLAKLLLEKKPPPPPPPPEEVEEELEEEVKEELEEEVKEELEEEVEKKPEPEEKPKPVEKPVEQKEAPKKKVQSAGVLAFKSDFASLLDLDSDVDSKLGAKATLSNKGAVAKQSTRSIITTEAASGTGGINTATLSKNVGGTGESIEGVEFARVESAIGTEYAGEERPLSEGPGSSRTDEEIQIVFDKYKSALYRIYNRELRKNPTLQGKMVLRLTIDPNGKVSDCGVDSSDMDAPEMDEKIVARVLRFNFGAKEGVPIITILFPIDFLPS